MKDVLENEKINASLWDEMEYNNSFTKKYNIRYSKSYPEGNKEITIETIKEQLKNDMEKN